MRIYKSYYLYVLVLFVVFGNFAGFNANGQRKTLFNDNWKFHKGEANAGSSSYDDTDWRTLNLPHDWSIEGTINPKNPMGNDGGYFPAGVGWYRKTFTAPENWKGKMVTLYFEGVYMNSEVFVNGKSLGIYPYGYSPFSYKLSPYLDFSTKNVIAIKVDNSLQKNCRWYTGSGIYRHVWVIVTDSLHVAKWGVAVSTPEVTEKKATVLIKTIVKNESSSPQKFTLNSLVSTENSRKTENYQSVVELAAHTEKEISQTIRISNPLLWTPETPHLYHAQIQIRKGKKVVDETDTHFGVRTIHFTVENGFQLNGKTIKLNGGCVHSDNGCLGAAAFDRAEERKVELLKAAGFNAVRTSHNIPSESFLDACDRLGLMVIDEAFDGWKTGKTKYDYSIYFDNWWKRDVESMVLRDRNHPSIIMWSIGNEIIERKDPGAVKTAKMLAEAIRNIDLTRPVTSAMTTWDKEWEIFDPLMAEHDVCGYNYQLHRAPSDHLRVPSRIILQTESYPRDAFSNWKLVQNHSYILGDFVWTAMDYLGESGIGRWYYSGDVPGEHYDRDLFPWHAAYCGDIDLIGQRKPISHYRSMLYNSDEMLYMAVREPEPEPFQLKETLWSVWPAWESWNWPGFEGKDIQVEIYSKYPRVRLYLNNQLIGEKETTENEQFKSIFTLPYLPGEIKAAGIKNGIEMESKILQTATEPSSISLTADRAKMKANGQDLIFITVEIKDKDGNIQPTADNRLLFTVIGPGVIAGVDNADIKDVDPYFANTRKAWKGRALVVVRSTNQTGTIELKVSSKGLKDGWIQIKSE